MNAPSLRSVLRHPAVRVVLVVGVVLLVVALFVFEPWKLFLDRTVDEAVPAAAGPAATAPAGTAPVGTGPAAPVVLARGELISHEHASSGSVVVLGLADGSRVLRLEDLRTSDGPLLKVWLTDAPVIAGRDGWHVFDDGKYVELGALKANNGNQVYAVPADADLDALTSVSIWCKRFAVSFGAAELKPA